FAVPRLNVPEAGLIAADAPRESVVVDGSDNDALLVSVVRLDAVIVVPFSVKLPALVIALLALKKLTLPVVPTVSDWPLVVPMVPVPVTNVAFPAVLAEIEAVGVPPALLRKPNLAELVDVAPSNTSKVVLLVVIAPVPAACQKLVPVVKPQLFVARQMVPPVVGSVYV